MNNSDLSWEDAEALVRQGFACTHREFSLKQVSNMVMREYDVAQNVNKLYHAIRKPWTNNTKESARRLSFLYPLYIVVDGGNITLKMHKGVVEETKQPGAMEFRYFQYIVRISKKHTSRIFIPEYNGPWTEDNIRSKIQYLRFRNKSTQ